MMIHKVFDNTVGKFILPPHINPQSHHFQSTPGDNLCEMAGRCCYDSFHQKNTRGSVEYFKHIHLVNHSSILEHFNFTLNFPCRTTDVLLEILRQLANRPGCSFIEHSQGITVTLNIRTAKEWSEWNASPISNKKIAEDIGDIITYFATLLCPLGMNNTAKILDPEKATKYNVILLPPSNPNEIWISYLINGVSRTLSHEQIRHHFQRAVSQRSARYIDESESDWSYHPLIKKYEDELLRTPVDICSKAIQYHSLTPFGSEEVAKETYKVINNKLYDLLIRDGVDKFNARKQSRSAARGFLGNALSTEMVFSASISGWKNIIEQRCVAGADAEIRLLTNAICEDLEASHPKYFSDLNKKPCDDGIGWEIA